MPYKDKRHRSCCIPFDNILTINRKSFFFFLTLNGVEAESPVSHVRALQNPSCSFIKEFIQEWLSPTEFFYQRVIRS